MPTSFCQVHHFDSFSQQVRNSPWHVTGTGNDQFERWGGDELTSFALTAPPALATLSAMTPGSMPAERVNAGGDIMFSLNPNYHGHLKLLNYHGVDGKSWFKKQGPLCVNARDYWVAAPFLPRFFQCTMSHVPPPLPVLEKNARNTRDFMLYLITLIMLRSWPKFF